MISIIIRIINQPCQIMVIFSKLSCEYCLSREYSYFPFPLCRSEERGYSGTKKFTHCIYKAWRI